jgi:hypothetical protein
MNILSKRLPFSKDNQSIKEYFNAEFEYIVKFRKNTFFYTNTSLFDIGKHLVNDFIDIDVFKSDFEDVKVKFEITFNDTEYPKNNEEEFYKYVLKEYLEIVSSPYDNLTYLLLKMQKKLFEVDTEIKDLEKKIILYNDKVSLSVEERYHRKHLRYYLDKNENVKNKIIYFITNQIHNKAYEYSKDVSKGLISKLNIFPSIGYDREFYHMKPLYIDNFNEILYKFGFLPVGSVEELTKLYKDDKDKFIELLSNSYMDIINELNEKIEVNHILNDRKEIFKTIFKHFTNNDFISINHMLPLQIEGLFYDFCILLGISQKEIEITSINDKLNKLEDRDNDFSFWSYEYFSFIFPVIRNKVAHGRYLDGNDKLQSYFLLFDLYNVVDMLLDDKLMLNKYVKYLDKDITNITILELYDYKEVELASFYQEDEKITKIEEKAKSDEFFIFLKDKIENISSDDIIILKEQIIFLKSKFHIDSFKELLSSIETRNKILKEERKASSKRLDNFLDSLNAK